MEVVIHTSVHLDRSLVHFRRRSAGGAVAFAHAESNDVIKYRRLEA